MKLFGKKLVYFFGKLYIFIWLPALKTAIISTVRPNAICWAYWNKHCNTVLPVTSCAKKAKARCTIGNTFCGLRKPAGTCAGNIMCRFLSMMIFRWP